MAKKCIKYGKNTYKPNILFDKIRNNPEFFAKKHGITGADVEKVLGIGANNNIDFQIPNNEPQKPKNLMPNSLLGKISDELRKGGGSDALMNVVKDSSWYKGLGKSTQENLDFNGVKSLLADSYKYYKANDKFKAENKLAEVRADHDAKLKAQKKSASERIAKLRESKNAKIERQKEEYTEKINKIQEDYKAKVQKIKESNTSYKAKVAERKILVGETIDELKNVLAGNSISRYITPTEVTRLIKLAGEIALYKNPTKALDRFFNVYTEIQYRAFEREQNEGNETITRDEYEELKAFVENFTTLGLDRTSIMTAVRNNDFSFSKKGTLTKEIEKQTDKIIERYEASQNTANGKGKSLNDAYTKSKEDGSVPESFVTRLKNWTKKKITEWTDRQFEVKRLLEKVTGENVYNRLINAGGSSSLAKAKHDKIWDKVFSGLDKEKRELLDKVIVGRRIIAIEENRKERGLLPIDHVNGITLEDVNNDFAQWEKQYGKEVMTDINKRATEYFKAFDAELDEMYNTGIISEEAYEGMKGIEYQPRVFLEHLKDFAGIVDEEYQGTIYNTGAKSVKREPIKTLKEGSTGDMVMDADWLLKVALSANSRMNAMNDVNKSFMKHELPKARKDFARLQGKPEKDLTAKEKSFIKYFRELNEIFIPNPISGVNRNGKPIYTLSKTPIGYTKNYYFDNGVRNEFFIADRYSEIWNDIYDKPITKAAEKSRVGKWAFLMPSKITKWVATGNNPLFFFVNTPRDFWHTYNFTKAYSNFLPIGAFQLAKDTFKAYGDKKRYDKGEAGTILEKALNYGIGMDFLYVQGKFDKDFKKDDKTKLGNVLDAINVASSYSELGFRIALFDRVSRNKLAEYNKKNNTNYKSPDEIPNEYERDNIYESAAASARSVMDFNQGGKVAKDIDGFVPYLNAGIQGTRTMVDAFRKDPKMTSLKVAQTALFMTSSVFATAVGLLSLFDDDDEQDATERLLDIYDRITPTQRMNYWNIPIPKSIAEKIDFALPVKSDDKDYYVIRIAKAYSLTPMLYVFEEATLNIMRKMYGRDTAGFGMIASEVTRAVNNNVLPIQLSFDAESPMKTVLNLFGRVPVGKILMAQEFGWDTYRDGYIDNDINKTVRRAEGLGNENIETFYKEMGRQFGLSPARTKASIEGVITSPTTSPYVSLVYTGMNIGANLMSDEQKEIISGRMIDDFKKIATGRIVTKTSSYAESLRRKDAGDSESVKNAKLEYAENNDMIQRLAKEFNNGKITEEEIKKTISELDLTNNEKNNMYRNISDRVANKDIDSKLFEVKYNATSAKEKAIKLIELYPNLDLSDNSAESQQLIKEAKQLGGIITADVSEYYGKLKREQSK